MVEGHLSDTVAEGQDNLASGEVQAAGFVARAVVPPTIDWFKSLWFGHHVVLVGPAGVGKSTFVDFLKTRRLRPETTARKRTLVEGVPIRRLKVTIGTRSFYLRTVREIPGHTESSLAASLSAARRPHVLVVMLDASASESMLQWFDEYLIGLNSHLDSKLKTRIKCLMILLNKADRVSPDELSALQAAIKNAVRSRLIGLGNRVAEVPIMGCVLVATSAGVKPATDVVHQMAVLADDLLRQVYLVDMFFRATLFLYIAWPTLIASELVEFRGGTVSWMMFPVSIGMIWVLVGFASRTEAWNADVLYFRYVERLHKSLPEHDGPLDHYLFALHARQPSRILNLLARFLFLPEVFIWLITVGWVVTRRV